MKILLAFKVLCRSLYKHRILEINSNLMIILMVMKPNLRILISFSIILFSVCCFFNISNAFDAKKIMILHSYHQEYPWTKNQNNGFIQTLKEANEPLDLEFSTEYLDTKRLDFNHAYQLFFYRYLKQKYDNYSPDVIFCSDDNALVFFMRYKTNLFGNCPVVFCGVNNYSVENNLVRNEYTGVFEKKEFLPNLTLIRKILPNPGKLLFIGDNSSTYKAIAKQIENDILEKMPNQEFEFLTNENLESILKNLKKERKGIIFLTTIGGFKNKNNEVIPLKQTIRSIVDSGDFTIISMEDVYLEKGILGGYVTSGFSQGKEAANIASKILKGQTAASIPLIKDSPNEYMFDYFQLEKFGLSISQLPEGSIIQNKPFSFYEVYKIRIWSGIFFLVLQTFIITFLIQNIRKRKKVETLLNQAKQDLSLKVKERTYRLTETNIALKNEASERKKTETSLESQNQLMTTLLDNLNVGVFMVEAPSGKPLLANKAAKKMLGRGIIDDADKKNISDVYQAYKGETEELYPQEELPIVKGLMGKSSTIDDMTVVQPDGKKVNLEVFGSPVINKSGDIISSLVSFSDITDRKKAEKEQKKLQGQLARIQRMESIGNLAGGIAHDFNNILFPIVGMSEMLLDDLPSGSPEYENVVEIFKAGKRGADLVKQILSFSRQHEHKMLPTRLQKIIKEVLKLTRATIPSNIELRESIHEDCAMIAADPTQMHQVAMNLITNAYHAVEQKNGIIRIELKETTIEFDEKTEESLAPGDYIKFSVSDNGAGIDSKFIDKVFEPYFTTKEKGKGTGLGLAVVHGIIKEHQGGIKVFSEKGRGSTFSIYLPTLKNEGRDISITPEVELQTGSEKILLVDDEASVAKLESQMLSRLGYQVVQKNNSREALDLFTSEPDAFDLVITDMTMPDLTGDMLARKILSIKPDTPIIICTGFSERISESQAQDIGIKGFLMKPVVKSDMAQMVRKVLDESKNV